MCGIAGIVSPNASLVQERRLRRMTEALRHRGPDGEGCWINTQNNVGLASRRLSIIDLSNSAAQPLHYRHFTIVFNGEIYNYIELKDELTKRGYIFTTQSDTEVIPAAYDLWGDACLHHFDGMFAFALYDERQRRLFLARDRFGEKPLYYSAKYIYRGMFGEFVFASEMKALWSIGAERDLSGTMMLNYLTLGYVQNPIKKTETFYSNILSLPQGHHLTVHAESGKVQMKKWYDPEAAIRHTESNSGNENETMEKFRQLFFTSVARRLRSDVSVGTSLSGGIDSSSVVAAIHQQKNISAHWKNEAFTAAFPGFEKDEMEYGKKTAAHFNLMQHIITPSADDWIKYFTDLLYFHEEPIQSSSVLTQFLVYRSAKDNDITVLLDGQGADEILGGYKKYAHWYLQQLIKESPSSFSSEKKLLKENDLLEQWGFQNVAAAFFPQETASYLQRKAFKRIQRQNYIQQEFFRRYKNIDTLQKPVVKQLEDILYYNTFNFGLPELLRYADRNSMANSREVRLPFLFHELVEFVFSLPSTCKIKNGFTKWILRMSMEKYLPDEITWRKGKTGFEPPQKQWMQNRQVQEMIMEARKKLVQEKVLDPKIKDAPVKPSSAHEEDNFDWRCLNAAAIFD